MKNIALIKSIVATSISSANPAELTEHIAALIQAHPEETRENALAILTGTRPRKTPMLEGTAATTMTTMSSRARKRMKTLRV